MAMNCRIGFGIIVAVVSIVVYRSLTRTFQLPEVDTQKYWGRGEANSDNTLVRPFKVFYEQEVINDLRKLLTRPLRLQEPLEGAGFEYGFNSNKVRPLVDYWRSIYLPKWKDRQAYLNQLKQFTTQINGLNIHFIHEIPREIAPAVDYIRIPLLLLHGWPGSVREFYDIIPMLTSYSDDHKFGFNVVAPSLVGYGFSEAAAKKGFNTYEMAIVMRNLMLRLGYDRFLVQGGDWGSIIGNQLTTLFPENVIGYHSNMCVLRSPLSLAKGAIASLYPSLFVEKKHLHFHFPVMDKMLLLLEESGYFHIQATKPDTIGIALATSPVGLLIYILEKFSIATNMDYKYLEDGGLDHHPIDFDAMLDNIMIYYLTNTITSSVRFYAESMSKSQLAIPFDRIPSYVPMGCVRFKNDLPPVFDWQLRDKFPNLIHSTYINHGGHFAALELPDELFNDFVDFVEILYPKSGI